VPPLFDVLLEELLDPPVAPPLLDVLLEELDLTRFGGHPRSGKWA